VFVATSEDRYDIANVLLRYGAKVNVQDNEGYTALALAVYHGFAGIVDLLLQKNADVNVKVDEVRLITAAGCVSKTPHF